MTLRASMFVHRVRPDAVAVIDCSSPRNPAMSVTNDAEAVVAFLYEWERLKPGDILVYKDTNQLWDGIWHHKGKFFSFELLCVPNCDQAIAEMRRRKVLDDHILNVL